MRFEAIVPGTGRPYDRTQPTEIAEILQGAEVAVVIRDPATGAMLWLRGHSIHGRLIDTRPERTFDFTLGSARNLLDMAAMDDEPIHLEIRVKTGTYTVGEPSAHQLGMEIPSKFDPAYFQAQADGE